MPNRSRFRRLKRGPRAVPAEPQPKPVDIPLKTKSVPPLIEIGADALSWRVVQTLPGMAVAAEREMKRAGLTTYLPVETGWREHHGTTPSRREYERPLIGNTYVFAQIDTDRELAAVLHNEHVVRVITNAERLSTVRADELADLAKRERRGEFTAEPPAE